MPTEILYIELISLENNFQIIKKLRNYKFKYA